MSKSYEERLEDFTRALQPSIEAEQRHYEQLPIGTKVWIPCAGIEDSGIEPGHVGRVDTYIGNRQYAKGGWINRQQAEQETGLILSNTHGICGDCSKILDEERIMVIHT